VVRDSSCTEAQARAIAYQLMGLSKSWRHVQQQEGMSAYFMYRDSASGAIRIKYTENLSDRFVKQRFSEKTDK
jgi:thiamine biosynthesis lipoprotein ApbE